jgi:phosphoglycolate phosphatase-like HAD superfamily hydrolase
LNADRASSELSVPAGRRHAGQFGPIRAILFDKDGTLVDFQRTWGPAVHEVMRRLAHGSRAAYERLAAVSRFVEAEQRFLPDSPLIGEPTHVFGAFWAEALLRTPSTEFFAEIDRLLRDAATAHLAPIGDPKAVLTDLAGRSYRLGMITNDPEATARAHVRKLGIDGILQFIAGTIPASAPNRSRDRSSRSRAPSVWPRRRSLWSATRFLISSPHGPQGQSRSAC